MTFEARKLKQVLALAISLLAAAVTMLVSYTLGSVSVARVEREIGMSVATLADQMQDKLDRGLFERYREISNVASLMPLFDTSATHDARRLLEQLKATFGDYAWIGYVDRLGKVVSATDGMLVGQDVSKWGWFKSAMLGPMVGDVHEAPLPDQQASELDPGMGRFVDVAAPVVDVEGETIGVLAAYVSWNWADEVKDSLFGNAGEELGAEVLVLNRDGVVLLGPSAFEGKTLQLASVRSAQVGTNRYTIEAWPDGGRYVTGFAKSDGYRSFAGLGWIILVREKAERALAPALSLRNQILATSLIFVVVAACAAWLLADRLSAPLLKLAGAAERLRRGEAVEIPRIGGYAEAVVLSESLRGLVAELQARQASLARLNALLGEEVAARTSEIAEQNRALAAAKEYAERATVEKSRFLAAASHDLRQPLHALILFARALSRRVEGPEAIGLVRQTEEALGSLRAMFDALLNISRVDAGLVAPQIAPVDLRILVERISGGFLAEAQSRGLTFQSRTIDAVVNTDAAILEAMIRNLVSNALKFTKTGGVLLAIRNAGGRPVIDIYDTGPGIPTERQQAVFDEFHRSKQQASGINEGLGLGLSIVRRYATLLGADVSLRSRSGRGSRFRITLADTVPTRTLPTPAPVPDLSRELPLKGRRILVLDDEALIVAALERELNDQGNTAFGFESAASAEQALAAGLVVDLAVVDFDLGTGETGPALIARLETAHRRRLPTLILSGGTDAATLQALAKTGKPWLTKPTDSRAITHALALLDQEALAAAS